MPIGGHEQSSIRVRPRDDSPALFKSEEFCNQLAIPGRTPKMQLRAITLAVKPQ
jgi:hypothetical protein